MINAKQPLDDREQGVQAEHKIAEKHGRQRHQKRRTPVGELRSAKQRQRGDGTEVRRMRQETERGGGHNHSGQNNESRGVYHSVKRLVVVPG